MPSSAQRGVRVGSLLVELQIPLTDVQAGPVVRHWFEESFRRLGGELRQRLLARLTPPADEPAGESNVGGPIGEVWANQEVVPDPVVGYSDENYRRFLAALSHGVEGAEFEMGVATPEPLGPEHPLLGPPMLISTFVVSPNDPRVGVFKIESEIPYLTDDPAVEDVLLALVRETASACGVVEGAIEGMPSWDDRRPWLLLVSDPVGERLGGLETFESLGLFTEVSQLPRGGYWLQATRRFNQLDPDTAKRVAELQLQAELVQRKLPAPYGLADPE